MPTELLFEVTSRLGRRIRISKSYWNYISRVKRPSMEGKENQVKYSLVTPIEVRKSKRDPQVYLYYGKSVSDIDPLVCAVVKHLNQEGFIITVYLTRRMVGEAEWKPS